MELTLPAGPEVDQGTAKEVREGGREAARSVLALAAVKALELSDQATEKAQQLARRRRRSIAARRRSRRESWRSASRRQRSGCRSRCRSRNGAVAVDERCCSSSWSAGASRSTWPGVRARIRARVRRRRLDRRPTRSEPPSNRAATARARPPISLDVTSSPPRPARALPHRPGRDRGWARADSRAP
jgi:hypothetical protein